MMTLASDRRTLLRNVALGSGLLLLPAHAIAALWPARGFTHSVASGEPAADSVLLWTRYAGGAGAVPMRVEVAREPGFGRIVARGEGVADPAHDWCVRATVTGLEPGRWYFYRFVAADGSRSAVGRTRTLPVGRTAKFNVAVFSCANKPFGYFNAYAHAAARADIDLVVHLGDYLYEYAPGKYPALNEAVAGRDILPATEIVGVDDYRLRYASYRADADLAALHRRFPMISIWDDHEIANDAWKEGAENHDPATQGPWAVRKANATQVHREWLPISDKAYNRYDIGDLVSLITLDTRVEGRDRQLDLGAAMKTGKPGLLAFRDGAWSDPKRTLMGFEQEAWAARQLQGSVASGIKWQLVAQQIVMGNLLTPPDAASWLGADAGARAKAYVGAGIMAGQLGIPGNMDSWGGYAPARSRLLQAAQAANANLVVVSGDSHNAWAFDLADGGKPAGVEFAGQGVTSPGFEAALKADPAVVAAGLVKGNPEMKWCDTARRGYLSVTFTPEAARSDWVFVDTIRTPTTRTGRGQAAVTRRGTNRMALV